MIVGVVLAAGASSRLGQPKQLLPFRGRPLLEHTLATVARAGLDEIIVVLGGGAEAILARVDLQGARPVVNPRYLEGQSTSLTTGLAAVNDAAEAVVFILGDQPLQAAETIDALIATYRQTGAPILVPTHGGVRGNPVLFARLLFPRLAALTGDQGARPILRANPELVREVAVAGDAPPADIDTWEDYRAVLRAAGEPDPGPAPEPA
jgi:molybdenum cofactor cytidylyltransferase